MAKTAPMVTSAVESHSTPIKSQMGRGLCIVGAGMSVQDFEPRLGPPQRRRRTFDGGDLTLEVVAIGGREQAGIVGRRRSDFAPVGRPMRLIRNGVIRGAIGGEKAGILLRHDGHPYLSVFLNDKPNAGNIHRRLTLTAPAKRLIYVAESVYDVRHQYFATNTLGQSHAGGLRGWAHRH